METIYSSEKYRATLFNGERANLVVTFDFWNRKRSGFAEFQQTKLIDELGFAELSIRPSRNDWYLSDETAALIKTISQLRNNYLTVTNYGFSMGGFAAFLMANGTGADRVIAVSPQYSIDRQIVPFETRWAKEAEILELSNIDLKFTCSRLIRGTLIFDPKIELDRLHATKFFDAFPNIVSIRLAGGGHPATRVLRRQNLISEMARALLRGQSPQTIEVLHQHALRRRVLFRKANAGTMTEDSRPLPSRGVRNELVPHAGIEPALLSELDFESSASTSSANGARYGSDRRLHEGAPGGNGQMRRGGG